MVYERRNDFDRRKAERRKVGRVVRLTDSNFQKEMLEVPVYGLVQFTSARSRRCKEQEVVLRQIAQDFSRSQRLRVGLFEVGADNKATPTRYNVKRLPTLLMFHGGEVVYRRGGPESRESLKKRIQATMALDGKVFVERRHGAERRRTPRRSEERRQSVDRMIWRDLLQELKISPWPIVLSIDPEDPMDKHQFSSLVESAAHKLRIPGLKTLHITGNPSGPVRRQLKITVGPPGVAVFLDGKLAGQFVYTGSKLELRRRLREILA